MTSISFLLLCTALVPASLVARNWRLVIGADDVLDGYVEVLNR